MVATLPCEIPQPEHVVEEIVHGGTSRRVVAGYGAELRLRLLGHQPRAEDFHPRGARGVPRGHPQGFVPGREVTGRLLYRQWGQRSREWAHPTCMCTGVSSGPAAEEARLWEEGDAGERLLSDAEPALHRRVGVPGPQRPVVGGRRGKVSGVDIGCGVGRAQECVSPVRQRMVSLCSLRDSAERPHRGGP